MFIYNGRIYRKRDWRKHGFCKGCDFYNTSFSCDLIYMENPPLCDVYSFKELFISRLFHAIIEAFYGAAKW